MILVVGATGMLGGKITRRLLEQGKDVRILVRHNSPSEQLAPMGMATSMASLVEAGAQPVFGDLKDRPSLDKAVAGISTVITTANSALRGGEDTIQTVDLEGNRSLVEAAEAAGVRHFIFISALGADPHNPVPFLQAKGLTEVRLRESGMVHTILAPDAYMEVWVAMAVAGPVRMGQPVTLVGEGRRQHSFVSSSDVAAFATAAVDHPAAVNQTIVIGGPEPVSWCDIVATYEGVLGHSIPVQFVALGEPVPGLPEAMWPLMTGFETYDSQLDTAETARTFGVQLTTLEDFARRSQGS